MKKSTSSFSFLIGSRLDSYQGGNVEYCIALGVSYEVVSVAVADKDGKVTDEFLVPTAPDIIDFVLRDLNLTISHIGVEPGVVGAWLVDELQSRGWNATCLEYANMGRLTAMSSPPKHSEEARLVKTVIKVRRGLLRETVRSYNILFAILKEKGLEFLLKRNPKITLSQLQERAKLLSECLEELSTPDQYGDLCKILLEEYSEFEDAEGEITEKVLDIACQHEDARRLVKIPGVSYVAALYFITAVENLGRFSSAKDVVSYLGLAPGPKKKPGDSLACSFLIAAAAGIMRSCIPSNLKIWGFSIAKKTNIKVAHMAVARKLAKLMYKLLVTKEAYRETG